LSDASATEVQKPGSVRAVERMNGVALTAGHGSLFIGVHVGASHPGGIPGTLEDLVLEAQPA
jgi:hypothetical protein